MSHSEWTSDLWIHVPGQVNLEQHILLVILKSLYESGCLRVLSSTLNDSAQLSTSIDSPFLALRRERDLRRHQLNFFLPQRSL